jgi:mono/diheme cytochrome c family protein
VSYRSNVLIAALTALVPAMAAHAGDAQAGKVVADKTCASCHQAADWKDVSEAELQEMIRNVASGKVKHMQKPTLTDAQIADVAAYWAAASK